MDTNKVISDVIVELMMAQPFFVATELAKNMILTNDEMRIEKVGTCRACLLCRLFLFHHMTTLSAVYLKFIPNLPAEID